MSDHNDEIDPDSIDPSSRAFNGLTAKQWAMFSRSVINNVSSTREKKHREHGATFPVALIEQLIRMYSRKGDLIFDPFVGSGTTLEACRLTGRNGIGIELNPNFYQMAHSVCVQQTIDHQVQLKAYNDDCRNCLNYCEPNSVQFIVTSPPYADFIQRWGQDRELVHKNPMFTNSFIKQYSDSPADFGNLAYPQFLEQLQFLLEKLYAITKPNGYHAWIVKDMRNTKEDVPYVPFHSDIAMIGQQAGFKYHDLLIWDQNERRKLMVNGYPSVFYTNQNHSFIIIFHKK